MQYFIVYYNIEIVIKLITGKFAFYLIIIDYDNFSQYVEKLRL